MSRRGEPHVGTRGEPRFRVSHERKVEGIPVGRVTRTLGGDHPPSVHLLREAGTYLARIHTVPTDGNGPLDGNGRGPPATWDAAFLAFLDLIRDGQRVISSAPHLLTSGQPSSTMSSSCNREELSTP